MLDALGNAQGFDDSKAAVLRYLSRCPQGDGWIRFGTRAGASADVGRALALLGTRAAGDQGRTRPNRSNYGSRDSGAEANRNLQFEASAEPGPGCRKLRRSANFSQVAFNRSSASYKILQCFLGKPFGYGVNPDGTKKWAFATGLYVYSSPAIGADGTIYFDSGDGNLYAVGVGKAGALKLKITPFSLKFPKTTVGTPSKPKTVKVSNPKGNKRPELVGVISSDPPVFAETNTCPASLAAGAFCTISVTFNPSMATTQIGMLPITDNAEGSPQAVPLSGTGK